MSIVEFTNRLNMVQSLYLSNTKIQKNGTKLVGTFPKGALLARHYIFAPMPVHIQKELIDSYMRKFPEELLALYESANGFAMFFVERKIGKFSIGHCQLTVYGLPVEFTRDVERLQPFNIRNEDLNRPDGTPDNWLKFGSYEILNPSDEEHIPMCYLFVDIDDHRVYSVVSQSESCKVVNQWESIDNCLCELFDRISAHYNLI